MSVLGLITEYNPFHNGHVYHLKKAKEMTNCDSVVCIMSGNFTQRGAPAIVNKWARTEMALKNQIDLVIELPVYYSCASAEFFAYGGIKLLDSLGIINSICFGSETQQIDILSDIAKTLVEEPEFYRQKLSKYLSNGISYPQARSLSLIDYFSKLNSIDSESIKSILSQPNNILGIEYIKALLKLKSNIKPVIIKRFKVEHNSDTLYDDIASATAIRKMSQTNNFDIIKKVVPFLTYEILLKEFHKGRGPVNFNSFEKILLSIIRKNSPKDIKNIVDVNEGMENRIKKAGQNSGSLQEILYAIKTKRYTLTRIQRILTHMLLGLSKEYFEKFNLNGGPQYIRILGFSNKGKELLKRIKSSYLPLVTAPHDFLRNCNPIQEAMLEADILATDIYSLGYPDYTQRKGGHDFYQKVISF